MVEGVLVEQVSLVDEEDREDALLGEILDVRADRVEDVAGSVVLARSRAPGPGLQPVHRSARDRPRGARRPALHDEKRDLADRLLEGADTVGRLSSEELVALVRRGASAEPGGDVGDEEEEEAGREMDEDLV